MAPEDLTPYDDCYTPTGSYAWIDQRNHDESFVAGFLLGCLITLITTAVVIGAINV